MSAPVLSSAQQRDFPNQAEDITQLVDLPPYDPAGTVRQAVTVQAFALIASSPRYALRLARWSTRSRC
eukprot:4861020-Alexandrium_andersonii.AAC.1